ncbi:MAG: hypothetical protein WA821_08385 [Anaerolineales bacterium]
MPLTRRDLFILALATALVVGIYLVVSQMIYGIGFPLDDSWIHQTYARNLALLHEWSFLPGQPSAGSTAPLWTFLLSIGFFLPAAPYLWTYLLGGLILFALAVLVETIFRRSYLKYAPSLPWAGLFFILEWHLAWASVSGMETLLHILLIVAALGLLIASSRRYLLLGLLTGISVWVRPDGLTLLGPLVLYVFLVEKTISARAQAFLRLAIGFLALFTPYLLFNLALSGAPMPNTFYAKQAEYATSQSSPVNILLQFFAGASLIVLPGFVQKTVSALRRREWGVLLSVVWMLGYILIYVLRLPVYQHGRYLMPAMGVFLLIGLMGFYEFLPSLRTYRARLARLAFLAAIVLCSLIFNGYGAYTYGQDVGLIESEMVASAKWAAQNIPPGALIAAHDIGALGFFDHHPMVDLAGLISPEVVPFIRDEARLAAFMDERGVQYLIAFPRWYPHLTGRGTLLFTTGGRFVTDPEQNMAIYRWNQP